MIELKEMVEAVAIAEHKENMIREIGSEMDSLDSEQEDYIVGDKNVTGESKQPLSTERFMKQT